MQSLQVSFSFDITDTLAIDRETCQQLMVALFRDRPDVESLILSELPGGQVGLSQIAVILAHPAGAQEREFNPLVVRIGSQAAIADEVRRYEAFVAHATGLQLVQLRLAATVGDAAAIAYDYLHQRDPGQPLYTLRDFLARDEELNVDPRVITEVLHTLLLDTLAQGKARNGWYNDARQFADQRPLWFYNQILPPLMQVQLQADTDRSAQTLVDVMARADMPGARALHEQSIVLNANSAAGYPMLRVIERDAGKGSVRLQLYAAEASSTTSIYRPFEPVAARIDLVGPPALLNDLPDIIEAPLYGTIQQTRYDRLEQIRVNHLGQLDGQVADGLLVHNSLALVNPLQHYYDLLYQPRALHTSIIHGDMNLGNILLRRYQAGHELATMAWLIDFDRTTAGGHTVFDAVKLETEYKLHILPHRLHSVRDFLLLEEALYRALFNPDACLELLGENQELRKAYELIAGIRRGMLQSLSMVRIPPVEYYLGLLAYGLAALKYANLYPQERKRWIGQRPYVEPLAIAAYLSASFAASTLAAVENQYVTAASYPILPRYRSGRFKRPWLVGRDQIIFEAHQQFQTLEPVVVLYGMVGSGRQAVTQALCAELEKTGSSCIEIKSFTGKGLALEECIDILLEQLRIIGLTLPPRLKAPSSKLSLNKQMARLMTLGTTIIRAVEEQHLPDSSRLVLVFPAIGSDSRVRNFIAQLCRSAHHTAIILVADDPWHALDVGTSLAVTPLTLEDVQAYVKYRQLPVDAEAIRQLYQFSHGLPRLLIAMLDWACRQRSDQEPLRTTINRLSRHQHSAEFARDVLTQLPESLLRRLEFAALLAEHGPEPQANQLFIGLAHMQGWFLDDDATSINSTYEQQIGSHAALVDILFPAALPTLRQRPEYPVICTYLAHHYHIRQPEPDLYQVAWYWKEAQNWAQTVAVLQRISQKATIITSHQCEPLYKLVQTVLNNVGPIHAESLFELAGDCANYLGSHRKAAEHYEQRLRTLLPTAATARQLQARLLTMYELLGDYDQVERICDGLMQQQAPDDLYAALCRAMRGRRLVHSNPGAALVLLQEALDLLKATRSAWPTDEASFFQEELVRIADMCAQACTHAGAYNQALAYLLEVRKLAANELRDESLTAMLDNNLGIIYEMRGQAHDLTLAQRCYDAAMDVRQRIGDRCGQLSTGQNLAMLTNDLAHTAADWDTAEQQFQQVARIAAQIDRSNRDLIQANYLDLLMRRGKFAAAEQLYTDTMAQTVAPDVAYLLRLNRAHLALWAEQPELCQQYLQELLPATLTAEDFNQYEWVQYTLECALRWKTTYAADAVAQLLAAQAAQSEGLRASAAHARNQGLWAYVQGDYAGAMQLLEQSQHMWDDLQCPYYAGLVAVWRTYLALQQAALPAARSAAAAARTRLHALGDIPAMRWLDTLEQQLDRAD